MISITSSLSATTSNSNGITDAHNQKKEKELQKKYSRYSE
jgi:hypothetical protein